MINIEEKREVEDNVKVKVYSAEVVKALEEKRGSRILNELKNQKPDRIIKQHNTTTYGLDRALSDLINFELSVSDYQVSHLALGTGTTSPDPSNESINNEVERVEITDAVDQGRDLYLSTYVGTTTANGYDITEVGIFTAASGGRMYNHALLSSAITKTSDKAFVVDITLQFTR